MPADRWSAPRWSRRQATEHRGRVKEGKIATEIWPDDPAAEGYRHALDAEVSQGSSCRQRQATARHCDPELRLQKQHLDLPDLRLYPRRQDHQWRATTGVFARCGDGRQHRLGCLGRYPPVARATNAGSRSRVGSAICTAGSLRAGRCPRMSGAATPPSPKSAPRSSTCCPKGGHGLVHPHHRHRPGRDHYHARQPGVQHAPSDFQRVPAAIG